MEKQNLIIFKLNSFYEIIKELEDNFNFLILEVPDMKILNQKLSNLKNYLIITEKKIDNLNNQLVLDSLPIKFSKLKEKINIEFLKIQFNKKSELIIGKYRINLNSRELFLNELSLKLTEKETNVIVYLYNENKAVSINKLQSDVWGYHSKLETHTVETHIYRLRQKILKKFKDGQFIVSKKNGYQIK
jgi:DNA-binding response OmpR family regulator